MLNACNILDIRASSVIDQLWFIFQGYPYILNIIASMIPRCFSCKSFCLSSSAVILYFMSDTTYQDKDKTSGKIYKPLLHIVCTLFH